MQRPQRLVVIGTSAGGVSALEALVAGLPREFPAPIVLVLHLAPYSTSALPEILARKGRLAASFARTGERLRAGRIYVAPPDHHLEVVDGHALVSHGPRVNGHRPAIDVLFRSAARARRAGVVAVVLTGALDDGAAGLVAVRRAGGVAVVQTPDDAEFPDMPANALAVAGADHEVPLEEVGPLLVRLVRPRTGGEADVKQTDGRRPRPSAGAAGADGGAHLAPGKADGAEPALAGEALYSCPECGGVLRGLGPDLGYACRVGHAYGPESLLSEQGAAVEEALWSALRALEERAELAARMAARAEANRSAGSARRFAEQREESRARAEVLRKILGGASSRVRSARSVARGAPRGRR